MMLTMVMMVTIVMMVTMVTMVTIVLIARPFGFQSTLIEGKEGLQMGLSFCFVRLCLGWASTADCVDC